MPRGGPVLAHDTSYNGWVRHASLGLILVVACYDPPSEPPCSVSCNAPGESDGVCPEGSTCGDDFRCHRDGEPDCARCLADNFDDGVIDTTKWVIAPPSDGVTEGGGTLRLVPVGNSTLRTVARWDMAGGSLVVEVVETVRFNETVSTSLSVTQDTNHSYEIVVGGSGQMLFRQFSGLALDEMQLPVMGDERLWRISHRVGAVELATSPDGATWRVGLAALAGFDPTSVEIELSAGGAGTNVIRYDNLRLITPACPAAPPFQAGMIAP